MERYRKIIQDFIPCSALTKTWFFANKLIKSYKLANIFITRIFYQVLLATYKNIQITTTIPKTIKIYIIITKLIIFFLFNSHTAINIIISYINILSFSYISYFSKINGRTQIHFNKSWAKSKKSSYDKMLPFICRPA